MSEIISCQTAVPYTWGGQCLGWHLVQDEQMSVIEELMPSNSAEVLHYHERSKQFFYVLSGSLTIATPSGTQIIRANEGLRIWPGIRHRVVNASREAARFLVISVPPSHGDRINVADLKSKASP